MAAIFWQCHEKKRKGPKLSRDALPLQRNKIRRNFVQRLALNCVPLVTQPLQLLLLSLSFAHSLLQLSLHELPLNNLAKIFVVSYKFAFVKGHI